MSGPDLNTSENRVKANATAEQKRRAARTAARNARDVDELAELLDMLGLNPREVR